MKYNKYLVYWYLNQIDLIYYKLIHNKKLTKKQQYIYDVLDEYDFYAPKKYHNHNNLS